MKRLLPCVVAALTLTGCGIVTAQAATPGDQVTVTKISDGDTFHVRDKAGRDITVRLLGADSPELRPLQCFAREAAAFATSTLLNKRVTVTPDPTQSRLDRYGRSLLYVTLPDGSDFSVLAARAGAARSYVYGGKPVQRHAQIVAAEAEAKQAKRGLWSCV